MIVGEAARLVLGGAAVGVTLALLAAGLLEGMVHGVAARDPWSFALAAALIGITGLGVSLLPAARAARLSPREALSRES